MGNYFQQPEIKPSDHGLLITLRAVKGKQVQEAVDYVQLNHQMQNVLTMIEFKLLFHRILKDQTETLFKMLEPTHQVNGVVDIYESLTTLIIFSNDDFLTKVKFVAALFDLDNSQRLEKVEVTMIFQTGIRAMCKVINLKPPTLKEIEEYVQQVFGDIDQNNDESVGIQELDSWLQDSYQLQDFMLKYAHVQTFKNAQRRTQIILDSQEYSSNEVIKATSKLIQENYSQFVKKPDPQLEKVKQEINYAYSAFRATDINNDHSISKREFPYLLFVYWNKQESHLKKYFTDLDSDSNGNISLQVYIFIKTQEWLTHLKLESPIDLCKSIISREFNVIDSAGSEELDVNQVYQILRNCLEADVYEQHFSQLTSNLISIQDNESSEPKIKLTDLLKYIEANLPNILNEPIIEEKAEKVVEPELQVESQQQLEQVYNENEVILEQFAPKEEAIPEQPQEVVNDVEQQQQNETQIVIQHEL